MNKKEVIELMAQRGYTPFKTCKTSIRFNSDFGVKAILRDIGYWRAELYFEWDTFHIISDNFKVSNNVTFKKREKDIRYTIQKLDPSVHKDRLVFIGPNATPKIHFSHEEIDGEHPLTKLCDIFSNFYGGWKELVKENRPVLFRMLGEKLETVKKQFKTNI